MPRTHLPNRRPCETVSVEFRGRQFTVNVGFDREGYVREVFSDGLKIGGAAEAELDDALVMMSHLLQRGVTIGEVATYLGRESTDITAPAASSIGMIAAVAADMERTI